MTCDCRERQLADMLERGEIKNPADALSFLQTGDKSPPRKAFSAHKINKIRELARNGGTVAEKAQARRILLKHIENTGQLQFDHGKRKFSNLAAD